MKLAQFFAAIAPFLEGRETHAQAAWALFGGVETPDAQRLALYGRFCRAHRFDALGSTFSETRAAVLRLAGEPAWDALVEEYFRAAPMRHAELNENGSELPAFLAREAAPRGLPAWLPELADLEWWSFRTRVAPDDPRDAPGDAGPLRIAATVELRPYAHDLCSWLEARESGEAIDAQQTGASLDALDAPQARPCVVLFWRDRELDTRHAEADPLELAILHALFEQRPLDTAAGRAGADAEALKSTVDDLHAAGVLLGERAV